MFEDNAHNQTTRWWQEPTRAAAVPGFDPAAATTMAWQAATATPPIATPEYAWSAESADADHPAKTNRGQRLRRPAGLAVAGAGAVAAVAAALFVVFSGSTSTAVSSPNASTPIASTPVAHVVPAPTATPPPPAPKVAPTLTATEASQPQASHRRPCPPTAAHHQSAPAPAPQPPSTTGNDAQQVQPGYQWLPWHGNFHHNWNFFRPHFDRSEHHFGS